MAAGVHLTAERLRAALTSCSNVSSPSTALLAATVPTFLRAQAIFSSELLSGSYMPQPVSEEFADRCVWASSDEAVARRIEQKRLPFALRWYPTLALALNNFNDASSTLTAFERLASAFVPSTRLAGRISSLLPEL
eukprot:3117408-Pleurochrysis_carterae.AAC.1